jgi:hypothetical protein
LKYKWRELLELEEGEDISVISVKEDEEIYGW